jgi:hypothetical protein
MSNNLDLRMVFENAKVAVNKAFSDLKDKFGNPINISDVCKLTQSTYRFERPLEVGNTVYQFPVLANQDIFSNTEQRLLQQDSAVIYQLGVFLGAPASATDAAFLPDSYPSPVKYGANATPANAIYNSMLSITVNNDILVPNWDVLKHLNVPETQQTAALGAGSPQDEMRGCHDGYYPMEPNVVLIGSKNNVIKIQLPVGLTAVLTNSRLIVIARCIVAQNSTVVS